MTIEKCKDFIKDGYGTWDDTSKPTTFANMYDFMKNQNNVVMNLAKGLWQPSTSYAVGTIIRSPNLPAGCVATCTTAGTSGAMEPKWTAYGTTVTDGSCKWKVNTDSQDTMVSEMNKAITSAINSLHNTIKSEITKTLSANMHAQYPVGSYIYSDKSANPSTYLPYMSDTTWVQTAAGRVLIGAGKADSGTVYNAGATGGEETHKLTTSELPGHVHTASASTANLTGYFYGDTIDGAGGIVSYSRTGSKGGMNDSDAYGIFNINATHSHTITIGSTGGNVPHNNMPPYTAVYIWKRSS